MYLAGGFLAGILFTPIVTMIPFYWSAYLGVEGLILFATATNKRFQKLVRAKLNAEEEAYRFQRQRSQVRMGPAPIRERMRKADQMLREIRKNHRNSIQSNEVLASVVKNLLEIERVYVILLHSFMKLDDLKKRNTQEHNLETLVHDLKNEIEMATSKKKTLLENRLKIIEKRIENKNWLQENIDTIEARLQNLDETLKLLREESLTSVDQERLAAQVDTAMEKIDMNRETISEIQTFSEISGFLGASRMRV